MHDFTISIVRDFSEPPERVFSHWIDPAARERFETPAGSGMRYQGFDTREGGHEVILVEHEGAEVGRMLQDIHVLKHHHRLVSHVRGVFGGETTMAMQNTIIVAPAGEGAELSALSQVVTLDERPTEDEVRKGWESMLDRFTSDLAANPLPAL